MNKSVSHLRSHRRSNATAGRACRLAPAAALLLLAPWGAPAASGYIENRGQLDDQVLFHSPVARVTAYFTRNALVLDLQEPIPVSDERAARHAALGETPPEGHAPAARAGAAVWVRFAGANPGVVIEARDRQLALYNFFLGSDPARWATDVPAYGEIVYRDLWPGIDVVFRAEGGRLTYDLEAAAGADLGMARFDHAGGAVTTAGDGRTVSVETPAGTLVHAPAGPASLEGHIALQEQSWDETGGGLAILDRDPLSPLQWSTFLGGSGFDYAGSCALDPSGNVVVTGRCTGGGLPVTPGAYDVSANGGLESFAAKVSSAGNTLLWCTYLGGSGDEWAPQVAIDGAGNPILMGQTESGNFPTTVGAYDTSHNGGADAYVTKLSSAGNSLLWSTYLGGSGLDGNWDWGWALALDSSGSVVTTGVTGSTNFPTTAGAYDRSYNGGWDLFVAKLSSTGSTLLWSTFLGGSLWESQVDLTLDGLDNPVLTGTTFSADFPTTSGAYDTSPNGEEDAFVAKLSSSGTTLLWSTFLGGGSQENFSAIDLTTSGEIVVAGETSSSDFPTTAGAYDPYSWGRAIFVSKLSASGSTLVWSTFIEGSGSDDIPDVAVAPSGDVVVVGETESTDFPVTPGAFDSSYNGGRDFFVSRLSSSGSDLLWSSFLGGAGGEVEPALALRPSGQAIILGSSSSADFPTTSGAFDPTHNGGSYDAAVAEIRIGRRLLVNPDGSGDWPNIQAAIDSSLGGDVIELADGIYTGPGNRDLDYRGKAITVRSQSGDPERCVLWCRAHAGDVHRALLFHSGEGPESRLEGIGILEGYMWDGGAIACSEVPCSPSITNCILINNYSSDDGGGIHCSEGSSPTLTDCVITGNRANDKGGGVHIVSGSPTFLRCTITDNQAIVSNGGGVYMQQDCAPTLTDCVISGNSAGDKAGGVYCRDSSPATLLRCTITDNLAPGWGGGLLCYNLSDPTVTGCTFSGNSGSDAGGISATLNSFVTVENTIIAFSAGGAAVYCDGTGAVDLACCDLYGNAGGDYVGCVADEFEVDGNLRDDPMFCDAGGADFHLRSCSPCLSAEGCGLIGALDRGWCGRTWQVPSEVPNIQAAIDASACDDIVSIADGTYAGTGNRDIYFRGKAITVRSASGNPEACVIDCQGSAQDPHRGFRFASGEDHASVLEGVKIVNGYMQAGAAIQCAVASPTIANCILANSYAYSYGGGAMDCYRSDPLLVDCLISGNGSLWGAGGLHFGYSSPVIERCEFRDNTAHFGGGLVSRDGSHVVLRDCSFHDNATEDQGAAIWCADTSSVYMSGCTLYRNIDAGVSGAILCMRDSDMEIRGCTLFENAGRWAGGIHVHASSVSLHSTIIAASTSGSAVLCPDGAGTVVLGCSDLFGNAGGDWVGGIADQYGVNGNISADPLFCNPAASDFTLRGDSPCAEENNPDCGQIGAWPVGCEAPSAVGPVARADLLRLDPPTPNPTRGCVRVGFALPQTAAADCVRIHMFDLAGRLVRTLVDGKRPAGVQSIVWDLRDDAGRAVPAGLYRCRLAAAGASEQRRFVVIR